MQIHVNNGRSRESKYIHIRLALGETGRGKFMEYHLSPRTVKGSSDPNSGRW